jgi:hypothetical protein
VALLANLRAFPPRGGPEEVWNHGVGKYTARLHAVPGAGERRVRIELELVANTGSNLNEQDPKPRVNRYEYMLVYGPGGDVDETGASACDWIAVGGEAVYAPLNLMEVAQSRWQGHNPLVTEANVRALDAANGGGPRFGGAAPTFRATAAHEAGRGSFAPSAAVFGDPGLPRAAGAAPNTPRPALLRFFGRD